MAVSGSEIKIKTLYAKRDAIFSRAQGIRDKIPNLGVETVRESFLNEIETIDMLRIDYERTLDQINHLELQVDPKYVINYQPLLAFEDILCRIKRTARLLESSSKNEIKPELQVRDSIRLPPIDIPMFNGDIKTWPFFFNSFQNNIHNNPSLSDAEKLYYLISKLSGRAQSICSGFTPTANNYTLIFETLKTKYEDRRMQASEYLNQIFELKSMSSANINSLELFLDKFVASVAALRNLKFNDLVDVVFLHVALKKLDPDTVRAFEMEHRSSEMPSFQSLSSFVRDQIKVMQRSASFKQETKKGVDRRPTQTSKPSGHLAYTTAMSTPPGPACIVCKDKHGNLYNCATFRKYSPSERYKLVKSNNLCLNCLSDKHLVAKCNSSSVCSKCARKHHTLLHFENSNIPAQIKVDKELTPTIGNDSSGRPGDVALCSLANMGAQPPSTVLLGTARILVRDSHGNEQGVRALLDSGAQNSFITQRCCQRLGLSINRGPSCPVVKGIGGACKTTKGYINLTFYSRLDRNINFNVNALVIDKVTERLPAVSVDTSAMIAFENLILADDNYAVPGDIDMLIGASLFPHLLLHNKVKGSSSQTAPYALETVLGYVIVGSAPIIDNISINSYCCMTLEPLESLVRKFWEMEEMNISPVASLDDRLCEEFYVRTTVRDRDGRYSVALPFKGDVLSLGDSRKMAEKRFYSLERRMLSSPQLKEAYDDVINEYIREGYISLVAPKLDNAKDTPSYFIPHHGVIREDKLTSKLRVVLDASAKTSTHLSLNDILYSGQNLQGSLFNIIANFRLFSIALSADIRKMFLCIEVREPDRRFQRILYRFDPKEPLMVFEFNRVCFGLKSSPFHALRTVKQLAQDEGPSYPRAKRAIESGLYMDDFVYSVDSVEEATLTTAEVIRLMKSGQFDLVKWTSNSRAVLDTIPLSHRLSAIKEFDDSDTHKVLGLCWSPESDVFSLKVNPPVEKCTKRTILSCVARLWDVMGFVAPVVLYAKLLIKQLWLLECDWDDTPPDSIVRLWQRFREELPLLREIKIPRHINVDKNSIITIVGFADASEKAYGGVVYFHVQNNGRNSISLISAKSRVSPRKVVSLARLELCAILVLARLITAIVSACRDRVHIEGIFAFSDSTVALCWVHSSPHRWDTFVANRVAKIQNELETQNFYHVSGTENPADCLSRGLTPKQIVDHSLWFHGPSWIHLDPSQWPIVAFEPSSVSQPPEEKRHALVTSVSSEVSPIIALGNRLSSWSKLLRSVIFVCRFTKLLPRRSYVLASDYNYAELLVLRELQRAHFSEEIARLQSNRACSRAFQRLKPFLHDGIVRVGGRLSHSQLSFDQRHPIVLPRKDHIMNLLVDYHHKLNSHAGPDLLMSILRQNYWILSARNLIRNRVHRCIACFRARPKPSFPEMAELKSCRVVQSIKPFSHTGSDFAGPFKVTLTRGRGIRSTKAYVCIFVCLTTRAVHIELVGDLSTAGFMGAFKRFLSRRGPVSKLYSDNGTNYVGAKRVLSELHELLASKYYNSEFAHILAENRIEWSLNVPAASHFGGNWETNIKSLKSHLYRVIGDQILSFEELSTVLAQIECVMNSRPLCRTLSSDPSEPLALTPAHFLNLTPLKYLPAVDMDENKLSISARHKLLDRLVQSFWKRWRTEYLHTLQSRQKWNKATEPLSVGTVVVLTKENTPPLHWPLGIVEEVFPGSDGVVRVARVKTTSGSYMRPVVRLCPLPLP